jgi:hypothetical protein
VIAQETVWDGTTWLILAIFASVVTLVGAVLDRWDGVAKAWGFVLFLVLLLIVTSDDSDEICEYDFAGNEYCFTPPP